ncbi:hypothetical protein DTO282F9_2749 [Paecilomyces variotii]|nr:hypothetical protein DTO282F9_2749 [Paecilomyces variotii]
MSQFSLFEQALGRGQAYEVHMNKVGSVSFDQAPKAIGTKNLNSCSAVMMVSVKGAILGHISPLPTITNDPSAGENHIKKNSSRVFFWKMWKITRCQNSFHMKSVLGATAFLKEGRFSLMGEVLLRKYTSKIKIRNGFETVFDIYPNSIRYLNGMIPRAPILVSMGQNKTPLIRLINKPINSDYYG